MDKSGTEMSCMTEWTDLLCPPYQAQTLGRTQVPCPGAQTPHHTFAQSAAAFHFIESKRCRGILGMSLSKSEHQTFVSGPDVCWEQESEVQKENLDLQHLPVFKV